MKHKELIQALLDGKSVQYKGTHTEDWVTFRDAPSGIYWLTSPAGTNGYDLRIKPPEAEKKVYTLWLFGSTMLISCPAEKFHVPNANQVKITVQNGKIISQE
jgi:hypothetical protein